MKLKKNIWNNKKLIQAVEKGGVVVMPTDTIYGIVGKAQNKSVVDRIYEIKKRDIKKPFIILIGAVKELEKFSVILSEKQKNKIKKYWPGPVTIIFSCTDAKFEYLHRGTKTLAFRVPHPPALRNLLSKVGPLVAPSANIEGMPPAETISEAKAYFRDSIALYLDGGKLGRQASKVVKLRRDGSIAVLRA